MSYQPMTIARLGELLAGCAESERWLMISEFLEEHRHEPREQRLELLQEEPPPTGDERWDVFLATLAEHLAAKDDRRGPGWCERRHLYRFWFPFNTRRDAEDIRLLADHLGVTTAEEVRSTCRSVFPDEPVPRRSDLLLDELFSSAG